MICGVVAGRAPQKPTTGFCFMASAFMSSMFLGSVDTSQPRPVAWVKGGPTGLQPPSSSSALILTMFAAEIWLHMAAALVLAGSAFTTDMIFASTSLSARTISAFMLGAARTEVAGILAPWMSELCAASKCCVGAVHQAVCTDRVGAVHQAVRTDRVCAGRACMQRTS